MKISFLHVTIAVMLLTTTGLCEDFDAALDLAREWRQDRIEVATGE